MLAGDWDQADHNLKQSLLICRSVFDRWGEAWSLFDLGNLAFMRGRLTQARVFLEEALPELRKQGILFGTFRALIALGHTMRLLDDPERARGCYRDALRIHQQMHYVPFTGDCLDGLAGIAAAERDPVRAARLFGAAHAHHEATGPSVRGSDTAYNRDMALARSLLDAAEWQRAWAAGCTMPLDQAVTYALAERSAHDSGSAI